MKKISIILTALFMFDIAVAQETEWLYDKKLAHDAGNTLKAATSQCVLSFVFELTGAALIISDLEEPGTKMFFGVMSGAGGVGIEMHNLILTNRACRQLKMLYFSPENSSLRMKMLKNIEAARALAFIQNMTPIVAVAAGAISFSCFRENSFEDFWASSYFWVPVVSICSIGIVLNIPEIVLVEMTRSHLNAYQQKISLGTTKNGMGISYQF